MNKTYLISFVLHDTIYKLTTLSKNVKYFIFDTNVVKKMDEMNQHIKKINSLSYIAQCKHVKAKLLSLKSKDIPYTMFLKKLFILLNDLPPQLEEMNIDIGVRKVLFINLWMDLMK